MLKCVACVQTPYRLQSSLKAGEVMLNESKKRGAIILLSFAALIAALTVKSEPFTIYVRQKQNLNPYYHSSA